MSKKLMIIFMILMSIMTLAAICIDNIELNRNIYCNDLHIKKSKQDVINKTNDYNLDDMEKHLDYLESKEYKSNKEKNKISDVIEKVYVPRFRILLRTNPLDIRLETQNYKFYVNKDIAITIGNKFENIDDVCLECQNDVYSRFNEIEKEVYAFGIGFEKNFQNNFKYLKTRINNL